MNFCFILGNPRSGTSMFRLMLNAHTELVAPPECGFVQWNHQRFSRADFSFPDVRDEFADAVLKSKKMHTWGLSKRQLLKAFDKVEYPTYQNLCKAAYIAYYQEKGNRGIPKAAIDKNNYYLGFLQEINEAMPQSKYIQMVRDVRDVAGSYLALSKGGHKGKYAPVLPTSPEAIASSWVDNNEKIASFLKDKPALVVRYEDLLRNTKVELGRVCRFLDVDYQDEMTRYFRHNDEPQETIGWKKKTLEPIDPTRAGAFRQELAPELANALWAFAQPTLEKYGYQL
jgi:hypothetical protein